MRIAFVPGFLDTAAVWNQTVGLLAAAGDQLIAVDLAGAGSRTGEPGPFTLHRFATDVASVLDATAGPVILVGHSTGAQVAELAAVARPGLVAGLVLVAPVPLAGVDLPADQMAAFAKLRGRPDQQRIVRGGLHASLSPQRLRELEEDRARFWRTGDPTASKPSAFKGPVLVIRGAEDVFVTGEILNSGVLPRFPTARQATIQGAGHWPHMELPENFTALLTGFLAGLPADDGAEQRHRSRSERAPRAPTGGGWQGAFAQRSPDAFAQALAPDVVLEAGALAVPVGGRDAVSHVMATAGGIYSELEFTHRAQAGDRTYLEWRAVGLDGMEMAGVTVLVHDAQERIVHAAIHHRPLRAALRFSVALRERLRGVIDASHFYLGEFDGAERD